MPSTKFPWLKTFAATVISVSLLFTPLVQAITIGGGGTAPNNSPYIAWSTVTPGQFTPSNGELVHVNWWLADAPGFVELHILDGHPNYGGQPIRELHGASEYLFNGSPSHPFPWNGRNDSNQLVAPGTYYYLLKAYSSQNSPYGDEDYGQIVVLGGGNQGTPPAITSHDASPDPFDPDTQNTCFDVNLDKSASHITVEVRNQYNQLVYGPTQTGSLPSGQSTDIKCWAGYDLNFNKATDGTYTYKLTPTNNYGTGSTVTGTVVVDDGGNQGTAPTILSHTADPDPFDSDNQSTCFDVKLDKAADYVTVEVKDGSTTLYGPTNTGSLSSGWNYNVKCWDGDNLSNNQVADGTYSYKVTPKNSFGTGSTVSGSVEVDTSGNQGSAPTILTHTADPDPFDSDNESTCFDVKLDKSADYVTVEVKNGSTTVFGPTNTSSLGGGWNYNVKCWDGRDLNNNQLSDGFYTYKLTPKNSYGTGSTVSGSVEVDTSGNQGSAPTILSHDADPDPFDSDNQTTCFDVKLDKSADYVTVEVKDGSTTLYGPINTGSLSSGWNYNVKCWDGDNLNNNQVADGTYTYKLTPKNSYGTGNTVTGSVEVDTNGNSGSGPIIGDYKGNDSDDYADRNPFNPYDYSKTTIRFRLNEDANVTFTISKGSTEIENITFSGQQGTNAVEWDGRKSNNDVHPEGTYTYDIYAWNIDGSDTETGTVVLDHDNGGSGDTPVITYHNATPDPFDPDDEDTQIYYSIDRNAYVTVEIYDDSNNNNTRIRTLLNDVWKLQGSRSVLWDGEDKYGDVVDDGYYEYKITACNQNDECDIEKGDVRVDRDGYSSGDLLSNVRVTNATFDPTEGERAELCFEIEKDNTEILVQVMDGNRVIETLIDNAEYDSDYKRCVTWDGRDDDNDIVNDDVYQFRIRAEQGNDTEVEYAYTEVDTDGYIIGFPDDDEFCGGFWDVPRDSPFCRAVELMKYRGIFQGYADGSFRPYADINRAETTKVILLALEFNIMSDDGSTLGFWDVVRRAWYMPYLRTAQRYGIVQGYPDGSFRPNNSINRVELLKIFLEASELDIPYCNYSPYPDTPLTSETKWYMDYACFAKNFNLMPTDGNGNFNPAQPMSRGDVAELFYRFEKRGLFDGYNSSYYGQGWNNDYYGSYNGSYYGSYSNDLYEYFY